jgi:hypothetical protein
MGFLQQLLYALNNQGYGNYMMNQMPMNAYAGSPYNSMGSFGGISSLYQPSNFMGGFNGISSLYQPFSSRYSFGGGGGNMFQPYQQPMYQPYQQPMYQPYQQPMFQPLQSPQFDFSNSQPAPQPVTQPKQEFTTYKDAYDAFNKTYSPGMEFQDFKSKTFGEGDNAFTFGGTGSKLNSFTDYLYNTYGIGEASQQPQQLTDEQRQMFRQARIFKKSTI